MSHILFLSFLGGGDIFLLFQIHHCPNWRLQSFINLSQKCYSVPPNVFSYLLAAYMQWWLENPLSIIFLYISLQSIKDLSLPHFISILKFQNFLAQILCIILRRNPFPKKVMLKNVYLGFFSIKTGKWHMHKEGC